MSKRFCGYVTIVLCLAYGGIAFAANWDDGSGVDRYWHTPNNWDTNIVPLNAEDALIPGTTGFTEINYPVIQAGRDTNAGIVRVGGVSGSEGRLIMEAGSKLTTFNMGGSSNIQFQLAMGWGNPGGGIFINNGGDVNTGQEVWIGYQPGDRIPGKVFMNAGTWVHHGNFEIARSDDCQSVPALKSDGHVHLDGGTIQTDMLTMRNTLTNCINAPDYIAVEDPESEGWMDVTGGTLIVTGNWRDRLLELNDPCGWLTAYGVGDMGAPGVEANIVTPEKARVVVDYDIRKPLSTTLTAYLAANGEAYDLDPAPYLVDVDPKVTLTWKPGDYVKYGGLYKGVPNAQKGNGHHLFIHTNKTFLDTANLGYPVGTSAGHLVGAQDANSFWVGSAEANFPGRALKLDTTYWWCVIEANDANVSPVQWTYRSLIQAFRTVGGKAFNPNPANNATLGINAGAPLQGTLTWNRGFYAASTNGHQVYFGTDFNEVNLATPASPQYKGAQTAASYLATGLELGKRYYWRIDEVNTAGPDPCLWPGDTWNFTIGAYRVVDEFANDNNDDDLRARWKNNSIDFSCSLYGSGAILYSDAGGQTGRGMRFEYDNNDRQNEYGGNLGLSYFSEGRFEYASGTNWTYGDANTTLRALALSYRGVATNDADATLDRLYVAVESTDGNMAIVTHDNPSAQTRTTWDVWNIDLRDFIDAGVNLTSVKYLYIGSGVRCNETDPNGGEGTVWFDNIRLYAPRCVGTPGYRQLGDLSGNCDVNMLDVDVLSTAWLMADRITGTPVPVAGNDPKLLVRYQFEGNYNNDPNGRVGAAGNGTPMGTPSIVVDANRPQSLAGNQVLYTDQEGDVNDYVKCGTWGQDGNFAGKSFSIVFWANQKELSTESGGWGDMVAKGESYQKVEFGAVPYLERNIHSVAHSSGVIVSSFKLDLNRWYHIAATYQQFPDMNGGMMRLYIDGRQNGQNDINEVPYNQTRHPVQWCDPNWTLGAQEEEGNTVAVPPVEVSIQRPFHGYLDDVRVYDRQLSEEEVMYLAGLTTPNYYPIPAPYIYSDIYSPEAQGSKRVNFKDLAVLAQDWMESSLWPAGF